ncbi:hypothetical protein SAMN02745134_02960 [Clostridium acidisoli DSM 12555]|uniref:Uncharacterized protein n=1 Tax=Clostridium acidisoli DSM 12555 TaxID=1121291 RepID=A0A1W1XSJ5_9CLOT|nr:hypothetical protein [Clostridium acidisoli]SMC26825.1 hypothetical protein SAMN02745134_02960 [Clostridium acidisoli DSM 12555]
MASKNIIKNQEEILEVEEVSEVKQINPATDKSNYLVQIISDGNVIKEVIGINSTVNIIHIGEQSVAADLK